MGIFPLLTIFIDKSRENKDICFLISELVEKRTFTIMSKSLYIKNIYLVCLFMEAIMETDTILLAQEEANAFLHPKLSREMENKKKLEFILQNSDISQAIVVKAQHLSHKNPYHNFGHQLGVAESAIRIALAQ